MSSKRHLQLKVWPEIVSYIPGFISFEKTLYNKKNPIDIDFSNVIDIRSSGLTILLAEVLKIKSRSRSLEWYYSPPANSIMAKRVEKLGLIDLLESQFINQSLFTPKKNYILENKIIRIDKNNGTLLSFPIYKFNFKNKSVDDKRIIVNNFRDFLFENIYFLYEKYRLAVHKLIQVFVEMAKNAADHSDEDGYFGLDIYFSNFMAEVEFAFVDLGMGINSNVREAFRKDDQFKHRVDHLHIVEAYVFALTAGNTTKPNSSLNRGIGMTIIIDVSKDMGIHLSVFDAKSRGILSNLVEINDEEVRKSFYNLGKDVGFYYYGKLTKKNFGNENIYA